MLLRRNDIQADPVALLAVIVLCVVMVVGLPIGHHHFCDSPNESEHCPVYLMQIGLVLLGGALMLVLAALTAPEPVPTGPRAVPLPLFSPRFTCPDRAPPQP